MIPYVWTTSSGGYIFAHLIGPYGPTPRIALRKAASLMLNLSYLPSSDWFDDEFAVQYVADPSIWGHPNATWTCLHPTDGCSSITVDITTPMLGTDKFLITDVGAPLGETVGMLVATVREIHTTVVTAGSVSASSFKRMVETGTGIPYHPESKTSPQSLKYMIDQCVQKSGQSRESVIMQYAYDTIGSSSGEEHGMVTLRSRCPTLFSLYFTSQGHTSRNHAKPLER